MCGQKDKVHELLWMIRSEMPRQVVEKNKEGSSKRQKLGLPVDTDRLPSYWKVRLSLLLIKTLLYLSVLLSSVTVILPRNALYEKYLRKEYAGCKKKKKKKTLLMDIYCCCCCCC